ncbi:MAG: DUF1838 domain-containing protein [Acidobacteria bacterium]|nr:DUF1838 domain-containing protein [Acidobacteriota bacterium]
MEFKKCMLLALTSALTLSAGTTGRSQDKQNGNEPAKRNLTQLYAETQSRSDGKDSVYYMKGYVYAFIPGHRPQRLFGMEGYNIRRRIETPDKDGYFIATREIVFYTDPQTEEILWEWGNPFTRKKNEVFHIANDPVNFRFRVRDGRHFSVTVDGQRELGEMAPPQEWDDYYVWHRDVFPFYPLPGWEKNYTSAELFDYYAPKTELERQETPTVMISWTRVGPWLPWMGMDKHDGLMIYHARSKRLESWDHLPERIKKTVKQKYPTYQTAPGEVDPRRPNVTSWTYYAEEMKRRQTQ